MARMDSDSASLGTNPSPPATSFTYERSELEKLVSPHVSNRLLALNDGPMLDALKQLDSQTIRLPRRDKDLPDRDRLAFRFESFKAVA